MRVGLIAPTLALRAGLQVLLRDTGEEGEPIDVVYEAASLEEIENLEEGVDVLLLAGVDIPVAALRQILHGEEGCTALLLLNDSLQSAASLARLPLRAWGILPLDCSAEELGAALRAIHQGLLVGAPSLVGASFANRLSTEEEFADTGEPLTDREVQVLGLLARGLANKQIAIELGISEHTVKFHVSSIYTKMRAANRAEAVRLGMQRGLVIL